jgi:hypothetical protein
MGGVGCTATPEAARSSFTFRDSACFSVDMIVFQPAQMGDKEPKTTGLSERSGPGWLVGIHARDAALAMEVNNRLTELGGARLRGDEALAGPTQCPDGCGQRGRAREYGGRRYARGDICPQRVGLDARGVLGDDPRRGTAIGRGRCHEPRLQRAHEQRHEQREYPRGRRTPAIAGRTRLSRNDAHP